MDNTLRTVRSVPRQYIHINKDKKTADILGKKKNVTHIKGNLRNIYYNRIITED